MQSEEKSLKVRVAQSTEQGQREFNEDAFAFIQPSKDSTLRYKGIVAFIADGTGGTGEGKEASLYVQSKIFSEYFNTPESWSVKRSMLKTLKEINTWLYQQNIGPDNRKLYTTCSILVLRGRKAYIFHIGDTRIYLNRNDTFKCLTKDHHYPGLSNQLLRALGMDSRINVDYESIWIELNDIFFMFTDGIHSAFSDKEIHNCIKIYSSQLQVACNSLTQLTTTKEIGDNASCQMVKISELPEESHTEFNEEMQDLSFPPFLDEGDSFEGFNIVKEVFCGGMGHVYLATEESGTREVALKCPNPDHEGNPVFLERFLREEWVASRVNSPYLMKSYDLKQKRENYLFLLLEYCPGNNLRYQLETLKKFSILESIEIGKQICKGLSELHKLGMVHRDIKPDNIVLSKEGNIKIVDYGIMHLPDLSELTQKEELISMMGSPNYMAPELFKDSFGSAKSDMFALGVTLYEMVTGHFPYGQIDLHSKYEGHKYIPIQESISDCPDWFDAVIKKCLYLKHEKRYNDIMEVHYYLDHPGEVEPERITKHIPYIEKEPADFWRKLCGLLFFIIILLLYQLLKMAT